MNRRVIVELVIMDHPGLPELTDKEIMEVILHMEMTQNCNHRRIHFDLKNCIIRDERGRNPKLPPQSLTKSG